MKRLLLLLLAVQPFFLKAEAPYEPKRVQEHFSQLISAYQRGRWKEVINEGTYITNNHPYSPFAAETHYYLAKGYKERGWYRKANTHLTDYLKTDMMPRFFDEAIKEKFAIGGKLERWSPDVAISIYNEISTALPRSEMAAECLFRKALVQCRTGDYKESVETYHSAIRRFPKSPIAPESYIGIAKVYRDQAQKEFPDPDILNLAEINIDQFAAAFPSEPRIEEVRALYKETRESFALELYEVGDFYLRTKKYNAAKIYFTSLIEQYPDTSYAQLCTKKLKKVARKLPKE